MAWLHLMPYDRIWQMFLLQMGQHHASFKLTREYGFYFCTNSTKEIYKPSASLLAADLLSCSE